MKFLSELREKSRQAFEDIKGLDVIGDSKSLGLAFAAVSVQAVAISIGATGSLARDMFFGKKAGVNDQTTRPHP